MRTYLDLKVEASNNPYRPSHWLGQVDSRPLALFRILIGAVVLEDFASRFTAAGAFLTSDGIFENPAFDASGWSAFSIWGTLSAARIILAAGVLSAAAFAVGFRTRIAGILVWFVSVSLQHRAPLVQTGGDTVAAILIFLSTFTDVAARWSVDASRSGTRATVHALVPRIMMYVPVALYAETARAKLGTSGRDWIGGPLIFENLHLHGWLRPGALLLREFPAMCAGLTMVTIGIEILIPILFFLPIWNRQARAVILWSHLLLQAGILATLKVASFTAVMFASSALWLLPEWIDGWSRRIGRRDHRLQATGRPAAPRPSLAMQGAVGVATLLGLLTILDPVVPSHLPRGTHETLTWLGLDLKIGLFTKAYPSERWEAHGVLADGRTVDPIDLLVPSLAPEVSLRTSAWMQVPYRLKAYARLGRYVCHRYPEVAAGVPLVQWELTHVSRAAYPPGAPPPAEQRRIVLTQTCE